jgi:hypothetical protein
MKVGGVGDDLSSHVSDKFNINKIYRYRRQEKSGSPALYTRIFQKTACHKMHGMSAPRHRDVNIISAEETSSNNHLYNKRITHMQR